MRRLFSKLLIAVMACVLAFSGMNITAKAADEPVSQEVVLEKTYTSSDGSPIYLVADEYYSLWMESSQELIIEEAYQDVINGEEVTRYAFCGYSNCSQFGISSSSNLMRVSSMDSQPFSFTLHETYSSFGEQFRAEEGQQIVLDPKYVLPDEEISDGVWYRFLIDDGYNELGYEVLGTGSTLTITVSRWEKYVLVGTRDREEGPEKCFLDFYIDTCNAGILDSTAYEYGTTINVGEEYRKFTPETTGKYYPVFDNAGRDSNIIQVFEYIPEINAFRLLYFTTDYGRIEGLEQRPYVYLKAGKTYYLCFNIYGSDRFHFELNPIFFEVEEMEYIHKPIDQSAVITSDAYTIDGSSMSYVWIEEYYDEENGVWHEQILEGETGNTLTVSLKDCPDPIITLIVVNSDGYFAMKSYYIYGVSGEYIDDSKFQLLETNKTYTSSDGEPLYFTCDRDEAYFIFESSSTLVVHEGWENENYVTWDAGYVNGQNSYPLWVTYHYIYKVESEDGQPFSFSCREVNFENKAEEFYAPSNTNIILDLERDFDETDLKNIRWYELAIDKENRLYTVTQMSSHSSSVSVTVKADAPKYYYAWAATQGHEQYYLYYVSSLPEDAVIKPYTIGQTVTLPAADPDDPYSMDYYSFTAGFTGILLFDDNSTVIGVLNLLVFDEASNAYKYVWYEGEAVEGEPYRYAITKGNKYIIVLFGEEGYQARLYAEERDIPVTRIYGAERYKTSYAIADYTKTVLGIEKFENVVLASGLNFPDSLAGSYLAVAKNAPILLAAETSGRINTLVKYLKKNLASGGTVYMLGGTAAISQNVEDRLVSEGFKIVRVAGDDRYGTGVEIMKAAGKQITEIVVCNAEQFPDALSVSSTGKPILLVKGNILRKVQKQYLRTLSNVKFTIIGGTDMVSADVVNALKEFGTVERLSGSDKFIRSKMAAEKFFTSPESVFMIYGNNYPDGLCAGPLAYISKAPIILGTSNDTAVGKSYVDAHYLKQGYVIGGTDVYSDASVRYIFGLSNDDVITEIKKD